MTGVVHQNPEKTKERILYIASAQDNSLCLIPGTAGYIRETGDFSILDSQVPFGNDQSKSQSLFELMKSSFYHIANNLGTYNLPLIDKRGYIDYLNHEESIQGSEEKNESDGESVMMGGMFVLYGTEFVELCKRYGHHEACRRGSSSHRENEKHYR